MKIAATKQHFIWPPPPDKFELEDLVKQRKNDISIKGRSGPIKEFEDNFLAYLDNKVKYGITFNSGTSALLAAYFALGLDINDEVIGPALTFHAALSPLFTLRAQPILVDVDIKTRCIDPTKIEQAITRKTKAITVVHQWGHPADMDPILKIARKHNLKVIEDCSHAHGSKYKGRKVGTFGDIAVFSLQAAKMLYAGEGGILVTNTKEYHDRATLLGHYRDRSKEEISNSFYKQFWVTGYGLKLRMSPYNAVTAIHSLKKLDARIDSRKKCLLYFREKLRDIREIEVPHIESWADMGAWYGFKPMLKLDKIKISREEYVNELQKEGVQVDIPSAPVLADLPLYNLSTDKMYPARTKRTFESKDFPAAQYLASHSLSFDTFTDWKTSKPIIDSYIKAFKKISKKYGK